MKKLILPILIIIIAMTFIKVITVQVSAATPTPTDDTTDVTTTKSSTPTPTATQQDSQIEKIKDLVASRVAELKLVDKRGIIGNVKSTTNTQITLNDNKNQEVMVDVDELTKFESDSTTWGISDIKKDDVLSIIGLYNKETERLLARFVTIASSIPQNLEGVIVDKDKVNYTFTIVTTDGKKRIINVENSTKTSSYDNDTTSKSGFSKINTGERILAVGFADKTDAAQLNASRIIAFPSIALSASLKKASDASPSTTTPTPTSTK